MTKKILQEIYTCDADDYCYYTEYVDDYTDPEYIEFTFEFPSGTDLDAVIADLADKSQQIKDAVEKSINEIYPQVKDVRDQREDALEDLAENELYDMAESVRDVVGGIVDSVETYDDYWEEDNFDDWDYDYDYSSDSTTNSTDTSSDWYYDSTDGYTSRYDESSNTYEYYYYSYYYGETEYGSWLNLSKASTAASNNSHVIAGVSFGVIGLASTLALLSVCNKKKIAENEQALLQ